jgi:hypothetical protein
VLAHPCSCPREGPPPAASVAVHHACRVSRFQACAHAPNLWVRLCAAWRKQCVHSHSVHTCEIIALPSLQGRMCMSACCCCALTRCVCACGLCPAPSSELSWSPVTLWVVGVKALGEVVSLKRVLGADTAGGRGLWRRQVFLGGGCHHLGMFAQNMVFVTGLCQCRCMYMKIWYGFASRGGPVVTGEAGASAMR